MAFTLPPNNLIRSLVMNEGPAADARRRKLADASFNLQLADWRTVDPGRGPVRGGGRR